VVRLIASRPWSPSAVGRVQQGEEVWATSVQATDGELSTSNRVGAPADSPIVFCAMIGVADRRVKDGRAHRSTTCPGDVESCCGAAFVGRFAWRANTARTLRYALS
jgi:hypothetical protein